MDTRNAARWIVALTAAAVLTGVGACLPETDESGDTLLGPQIVVLPATPRTTEPSFGLDSAGTYLAPGVDGATVDVMRQKMDGAIAILNSTQTITLAQAPDAEAAYLSDADPYEAGVIQTAADSFAFAEAQRIIGVRWWGAYSDDLVPTSDRFSLRFHEDAGGLPGPVVYAADLRSGDTRRTPTNRTSVAGAAEFSYQVALTAEFQAQPGAVYWLSIVNDTAGSPTGWGWESSSQGDGLLAFSQDAGATWHSFGGNLAFELFSAAPSPHSEAVAKAAVRQGMEALFMSNLVVLPTAGVPDAAALYDGFQGMSAEFVAVLDGYIAASGPQRASSSAVAFEARNFIQVFREAAQVVSASTEVCAPGVLEAPECAPLRADDESGEIIDAVLASCPCDLDCDGDADGDDMRILAACGTGPAVPYAPDNLPPGCPLSPDLLGHIAADLDLDMDVDARDFAILQRALSGRNHPVTQCDATLSADGRFSREVRSPFFVGRPTPTVQEQVITPDSVAPGNCVVVTKEIQGVKAVIRPVIIPIWIEPWYARATIVGYETVWVWEFVPAEFLKTINYCNLDGTLSTQVNVKVVLERQLLHFWSFLDKETSLHDAGG